jgi:hypothetical protein
VVAIISICIHNSTKFRANIPAFAQPGGRFVGVFCLAVLITPKMVFPGRKFGNLGVPILSHRPAFLIAKVADRISLGQGLAALQAGAQGAAFEKIIQADIRRQF